MRLSFAQHAPGADVGISDSRRQPVRGAVLHRPQARCPGVLDVATSRRHSSPGTWNVTPCADGHAHEHYDVDVRCTHAAGGNYFGPGFEVDGYQGERVEDGALRVIGLAVIELEELAGVPKVLYPTDAPRLWADRSDFRGWINHGSIDYPPDLSLRHHDFGANEAEFARALELAGVPATPTEEITMYLRRVVADRNPYKTAGGAELATFPGAHVFVDGAGPNGMHIVESKKELDNIRIMGVREHPLALNRASFALKYGVRLDDIDLRRKF